MSPTAPEGPPQGLTCMKCDGTGVVDDGEIDCHPDGTPFTNGPVKCVKDCPKCKGSGIHAFPAPERPAPKNAAGHSIRADLAATAEEFVTIPRSPTIGMLRVLGCTATTFAEMLEEAARANLWNYVAAPEAPTPVEARQPLPPLPLPECTYADHSYPAYTANQMRDYARAALAAPAGAIQPHLDHQVGAQVTPLPLGSAGGAPSATAGETPGVPTCPTGG